MRAVVVALWLIVLLSGCTDPAEVEAESADDALGGEAAAGAQGARDADETASVDEDDEYTRERALKNELPIDRPGSEDQEEKDHDRSALPGSVTPAIHIVTDGDLHYEGEPLALRVETEGVSASPWTFVPPSGDGIAVDKVASWTPSAAGTVTLGARMETSAGTLSDTITVRVQERTCLDIPNGVPDDKDRQGKAEDLRCFGYHHDADKIWFWVQAYDMHRSSAAVGSVDYVIEYQPSWDSAKKARLSVTLDVNTDGPNGLSTKLEHGDGVWARDGSPEISVSRDQDTIKIELPLGELHHQDKFPDPGDELQDVAIRTVTGVSWEDQVWEASDAKAIVLDQAQGADDDDADDGDDGRDPGTGSALTMQG